MSCACVLIMVSSLDHAACNYEFDVIIILSLLVSWYASDRLLDCSNWCFGEFEDRSFRCGVGVWFMFMVMFRVVALSYLLRKNSARQNRLQTRHYTDLRVQFLRRACGNVSLQKWKMQANVTPLTYLSLSNRYNCGVACIFHIIVAWHYNIL